MAKPYEHCGVTKGYTRPTECAPGYECKVQNEWYSQVRRPLRDLRVKVACDNGVFAATSHSGPTAAPMCRAARAT